MNFLSKLFRKFDTIRKKPTSVLVKLTYLISPVLGDRVYLKILFYLKFGYKLDLENPKTFNEKLNWMKLYYRDSLLSVLSDKYEVKSYVQNKIGGQYIVKTYGVWEKFDDIDFDILPSKFVLKTTHDQGGVIVCSDKTNFDFKSARSKINSHLNRNLFYKYREWPYKHIKPRIIAEEFLENDNNDLDDFKFFCFDGTVKVMYIATDRGTGRVKFDFFDMEFNHLELVQTYPQSGRTFRKPENFELMVGLAQTLSKGLPQVRIDFYDVNGSVYFGEYTFFHHGGLKPFHPQKWDFEFGDYIELPLPQ